MLLVSVIYTICSLYLASVVSATYSSKALEGLPVGYMSDCPGSTKEAVITKKSLKNLSFTVQGPGNAITARRVKYSYYQMKSLVKDPDVDFKRKTVLYIGGFLDSPGFPIALALGKHYKDLGYTVLLLDTNAFTTMEYPVAARFMRPVGYHVAEMLVNLTKMGLNPKRLELIGLSLGGQTMSFIAKNFRQLTGRNLTRLTGLDPSGPCFRNLGPEDRLDSSDADYVDVISTNIDGYGMAAPMGHATFYVNGGEFQPGDFHWMLCTIVCSHIRAYTLWLAVLQNQNSFIAIKCDSVQQARNRDCYDNQPQITNLVGLKTDKTKHGIFYLSTHNAFPYFMGEKGLNKKNDFLNSHLEKYNDDNLIKMK